MAADDLAALQDVKDWLTGGGQAMTSAEDPLLKRTITTLSGSIYTYLSREIIAPRSITERYDGYGNSRLLLKNYPVLAVAQLIVDGVVYQVGTYPTATNSNWPPGGYVFTPWDGRLPGKPQAIDTFLSATGRAGTVYGFPWGRQNVQVTYTAGYQVTGEAATVPANPGPYTVAVQAPRGPWASDQGVTYASGAPLTAVTVNPAQGQYIPPTAIGSAAAPGNYTFAAADAGAAVLLSYGFIPSSLNQACIEWVAERYRYRGRIGQKAQTVSGQTTASYDTSAVPAFIKGSLDPYRNVVPSMAWG